MSSPVAIAANANPELALARPPHVIRMDARDNVAIVANEGGLAAGAMLASSLVLVERVPQGHKVALVEIAAGAPVVRYGVIIGTAEGAIGAGRWVHERLLKMPEAASLHGLPMATAPRPSIVPL